MVSQRHLPSKMQHDQVRLSWNEIRDRALAFSNRWQSESNEKAEAKTFWDEFFQVFGISRRRTASFETPAKKSDGKNGFIDLLWKGQLLVEHKSLGKNLNRAVAQAYDYFPGIKERDLPRYIIVTDFARFRLYDLESKEEHEFELINFSKNIHLFAFMAGYQTRSFGQQDPVNIKAAEQLGLFHDQLKESGYQGHPLEVLLVRVLFCLFSEDTSIFLPQQFREYLEQRTNEDGSDIGMHLAELFQVLNTPTAKRQKTLDEQLDQFPHINGKLFEEQLPLASFDRKMRDKLLECCTINWSRISPAIFGSLFQSIMSSGERRQLGGHYTSETNILRVIHPLFLDKLRNEFENAKADKNKLILFHKKLASVRIFDPACGCGNFLIIAYRELRLLEIDVLRELTRHHVKSNEPLDIESTVWVNVDQFYGIEIEEFPAQIAQVALWLMDHQMNLLVSERFGQYFKRLPLITAPKIVHGNALKCDWRKIVDPKILSYIVGNPPFIGSKYQTELQRSEVNSLFEGVKGSGNLDYVACWYSKAVDYMRANSSIRAAFVSTNSITQGEQVGVLWPGLIDRGVQINFAHRTFKWQSEARGKAAVHCVVIGFALENEKNKQIFDYESAVSEPSTIHVKNINPYLVDAANVLIQSRSKPICNAPEIRFGNQPIDGGYLSKFTTDEKNLFLKKEPAAKKFFKRFVGSDEFINGQERWCLWLHDLDPHEFGTMKTLKKQIELVKNFRLKSKRPDTRKLAQNPALFAFVSHPSSNYILIPSVSSENRRFIPIGFMTPETIASNLCSIIPNATLYHFGILTSTMHMAWTRAVCGRLESRYRYSANIVYNNFPWPIQVKSKQKELIENAARQILIVRSQFSKATLAELYDPVVMPPELVKAHNELDRAVDSAYLVGKFSMESQRVAFLFQLYDGLVRSQLAKDSEKKITTLKNSA